MVYFTMAVRKLANGRWEADITIGFRPDGKRDRRRRLFNTKKDATAFEREMLIKKSPQLVSGRIPLNEFVEKIYWPNKKNLRPSTKQGYQRDLKLRILPALGHKYIEDISRHDVQMMISACPTRKTATNARETLSAVLGYAVNEEMLTRNVAGFRYEYPQKKDDDPERYGVWLTTFRQHRLFFEQLRDNDCPEDLYRIAVLGLCFGLRKGEILGLEWDDVDLDRNTIKVRQTFASGEGGAYLDGPKTPASYRIVPIMGFARAELKKWKRETSWVVPGFKGRRMSPSTAKKHFQQFYDAHLDIPRVTMYTMRHSFATACISAKIDVAKVSKWLGHKEVSTTYNRYVRPLLQDLQDEVSTIDAAFAE